MSRGIMRYTAFLCCLLFLASMGGVFATWYFAEDPTEAVTNTLPITLEEFTFSDISQEETEEVNKDWRFWRANYRQRGKEWEREATIQLFDENGELLGLKAEDSVKLASRNR